MIDPFNITDFNRTEAELEELLLFCVCVAGHNARTTAKSLDGFLADKNPNQSPFDFIRGLTNGPMHRQENETLLWYGYRLASTWRKLIARLRDSGIGTSTKVSRCMWELAYSGLDLKACSVDDLERVYGIGPKTSRFFLTHSRETARLAVLDVHMLRHLSSLGYRVPKTTPSSAKQYKKLEQVVLRLAELDGKTPAEYDLDVWIRGASK